jgi:hypothetical protein
MVPPPDELELLGEVELEPPDEFDVEPLLLLPHALTPSARTPVATRANHLACHTRGISLIGSISPGRLPGPGTQPVTEVSRRCE